MFAIVKISGKQHRVEKGDILSVAKLEVKDGEMLTFDEVLLVSDDKKTTIGTPTVTGAVVKATVITGLEKGEKLNVRRYKHKVRSRRSIGFRPKLTKLEIVSIG
jgi:large subunit ribosomal protein L21